MYINTAAVYDPTGEMGDYSVAMADAVPPARDCACELRVAVNREFGCVCGHRNNQFVVNT